MGEPGQPGGQRTRRTLVVIGGSAGSHQPLLALMAGLPADLAASVLVTIHTGEHAPSNLPALLTRAGPLPAEHARDGQPLTPGTVLVAPPGVHLRIADGIAELSHEPRVNRVRPAIDVLFSSAAATAADGVVAVLLSGALDDGAVGAALITQAGGTVLIQDPAEARFASIPQAAQRAAPPAGRVGVRDEGGGAAGGCSVGDGQWPGGRPAGDRVVRAGPLSGGAGPLRAAQSGHAPAAGAAGVPAGRPRLSPVVRSPRCSVPLFGATGRTGRGGALVVGARS